MDVFSVLRPAHHRRTFGVASIVAIAGLILGLDTGCIGPITAMPQFAATTGSPSPTQQGVYVASVLLSASASALTSGHISDAISRRYAILIGSVLSAIGATLSSASPNWATLIVARLISGAGIGQSISISTVYLVELAPRSIRGVAACVLQFFIVTGIMSGYFVAFGTQQNIAGSFAWRAPFIVQAACATALAVGMIFVPFSPRWLMQKGRRAEATAVLSKFRADEAEIEAEMAEIYVSLQDVKEQDAAGFFVMFQKRYARRTMLGIFIMTIQQMTGIDAVLYYAPSLFQQAGLGSTRASFLASGVSGIVMLAATVPAQIWIDKWGRRKPLIFGGAGIAICLIVIGSLYARFGVRTPDGVRMGSAIARWVVIVLTYLFVVNFSWSWAVVGKIYACEIIPTHIRARVASLELLANWAMNFAVTISAPILLRSSPAGAYFLYGFSTVLAVIVCIYMPETKGRSLEDIEQEFEKRRTAVRGNTREGVLVA